MDKTWHKTVKIQYLSWTITNNVEGNDLTLGHERIIVHFFIS